MGIQKRKQNAIFIVNLHDLLHSFSFFLPEVPTQRQAAYLCKKEKRGVRTTCAPPSKSAPALDFYSGSAIEGFQKGLCFKFPPKFQQRLRFLERFLVLQISRQVSTETILQSRSQSCSHANILAGSDCLPPRHSLLNSALNLIPSLSPTAFLNLATLQLFTRAICCYFVHISCYVFLAFLILLYYIH